MELASRARASMATFLSPKIGTKPCQSVFRSSAFRKSSQSPATMKLIGFSKHSVRPNAEQRWTGPTSVFSYRKGLENPGSAKWTANAVDGNSTSTTADADRPSPPAEEPQEEPNVVEYEEPESVGKAVSQMKQERLLSGEDNPSKTEEFWRGVLEEIQLIEWPPLQKVLGTTGVVTGIIIGSSLVLLTVNALLARLSDTIFNNAPPA